jgi:hypothetical protein
MDTNIGQRVRQARLDLAQKRGEPVTLSEFGKLVAKAQGKKKPYTGQAVTEWESGRSKPGYGAMDAIAKVTGNHREWLVWGSITPPEPNHDHPKTKVSHSRKVNPPDANQKRA